MAANINPIFTKTAQVKWVVDMTAANTSLGLDTGTSYDSNFSGSTEGSYVSEIRVKAGAGQNTAASVFRVYINNGSSISTRANSVLFTEVALPALTGVQTNSTQEFIIPMDIMIPSGYKIYFTLGTAPGGSGTFQACVVGGNY